MKTSFQLSNTHFILSTTFSDQIQRDHLPGKPGNVREFDSCHGNKLVVLVMYCICIAVTHGCTGDKQCSVPLQNPVNFSFDPHDGAVQSVECSPYHRNMFLTSASDCTARIYSMLQAS